MGNSNEKVVDEPCLPEPWQKMEVGADWTTKYQRSLRKEISKHILHENLERANILLLGSTGAGKSSFVNSVASISKGAIAMPHHVRSGTASSTTLMLKKYVAAGKLQKCTLLDTMGMAFNEKTGFNVDDIMYLINGNIKPNYRFNPASPIDKQDHKKFRENPKDKDKAHCVVFVLEAKSVYHMRAIPPAMKQQIQVVQKKIYELEIPMVILLTQIDELCDEVRKDVKRTFHSKRIRDAVKNASELFKVPEMTICPIQNYSRQQGLDVDMNILILFALRRMLHFASDRLKSIADQEESDQEENDQEENDQEENDQKNVRSKEQIINTKIT